MSCPYFSPADPLPWKLWPGRLRPPLGELYDGECVARPAQPHRPSTAHLAECCNLGYARSKCNRMPADGPDAVRFSIAKDDGAACGVLHIAETEGELTTHGMIELNLDALGKAKRDDRSAIELQAEAFVESYLRAKTKPSTRRLQRG